jgi:hypothetical protein
MLRAFIDDSGSGGDSTYYVLAGYLSTVEEWGCFAAEWREELSKNPPLGYFKSSEAESLKGEFAGFSAGIRNARIDRLIEIIRNRALHAISVRMKQKDYDEILRSAIPEDWDNPYFYLFTLMVLALPRSSGIILRMNDRIGVVFDRQSPAKKASPTERRAAHIYERARAFIPAASHLGSVSYRDDKGFVPLQAADLLAWQTRRFWCTPDEPKRLHFDAARSTRFPAKEILVKRAEVQEILDQWITFQALHPSVGL